MQRKASKKTRQANAAERRYQAWTKMRPCCTCGAYGVFVHHCEGSAFKLKVGFETVLLGHYFVLPLCAECDSVITNNSRRAFRESFGLQSELWAKEAEQYSEETGDQPPTNVVEGIRLSRS